MFNNLTKTTMPGEIFKGGNKTYLTIVGGNLVQKVDANTPNAKRRDYELPDKTTGFKYELNYMNWTSRIKGITFKDGDFGKQCMVELEDAVLTIGVSSRYFQDFACKLVGSNVTQPYTLHPYDMETDTGRKTGISLQQEGEKLKNYFYDFENKKNLHGFPEVDKEELDSLGKDYWKVYFIKVAQFLMKQIEAMEFPNIETAELEVQPMDGISDANLGTPDLNVVTDKDVDEIFSNDLPFKTT